MNPEVPVREVMDREFVGVSEGDELLATVEVLLEADASAAVVLRGSEPVGLCAQRDVLDLLVAGDDPDEATVGEAMTETVPTVRPDATLGEAMDRLSGTGTRRLVVSEGGRAEPVGMLSEHDLLAAAAYGTEEAGPLAETMPDAVAATGGTAVGMEARTESEDTYEDQGICERCGTLTRDLTAFNGQLLCADCRDV